MAIIINDPYARGGGAVAGERLGTQLGGILESLAQRKLQNLEQRQAHSATTKGLAALGIPIQQASEVAGLPKELQALTIKNYLQAAEQAGLNQSLSGLLEAPQMDASASQIAASPTQQSFADVLTKPRLKPEHKLRIAEMQHKRGEAARPIFEKVAQEKESARQGKATIDRMIQISKNPKSVNDPRYLAGLRLVGLDNIDALKKPGTLEFDSLKVNFFNNLKTLFGARPTNFDVQNYLAKLPNLMQDPVARERIAKNLKKYSEALDIKYNAKRDIIKKSGGFPPPDLDLQVEDRAGKNLDKIWNEFEDEAQSIVNTQQLFKTINEIPKASGRKIRDTKTGKIIDWSD